MANDKLLYVGVGIGEYRTHDRLEHATSHVERVQQALDDDGKWVRTNPTTSEINSHLNRLAEVAPGGSLLFHWVGHGKRDGDLVLVAPSADTPDSDDDQSVREVVRRAQGAKANQQLFMFDVCYSGKATDLSSFIREILDARQQDGPRWVGILTSCRSFEQAEDGVFGTLLTRLLTEGPRDPDLQAIEWSHQNRLIDGETLGHTIQEEWPTAVDQRPEFRRDGHKRPMIPNPRYRADAPPEVVAHLLRAARSGADPGTPSAFTGRVVEVNTVTEWITSDAPGIHLLTGPAGTGKSAILGRVLCLSNPTERRLLLADNAELAHEDPGENSIAAHVHARGLTVEQVAAELDQQLSGNERGRVLALPAGAARNVYQLIGDLRQYVERGKRVPCLVIDGLDEAREHAEAIAHDLITPLQPWARVIVSSRDIPTEKGSLLDDLDPHQSRLDLGAGDGPERTLRDVHSYLTERLRGVAASMDADAVADLVVDRMVAGEFGEPFLFARLLADRLRVDPVDTDTPEWEALISTSYADVFIQEIEHIDPPEHRHDIAGPDLAHQLLTALAWSFGRGFPVPEWLTVAGARSTVSFTTEDIRWVLHRLGQFVILDGEAGEAVYRLAHASLTDLLRPPFRPTADEPFDPATVPVTQALLNLYRTRLHAGVPASSSGYLWFHAAAHAASAGTPGTDGLRELSHLSDQLAPDLATALLIAGDVVSGFGHDVQALAPTEEAVRIYRDLAATNPGSLPGLASALNNLGIHHSNLGHHGDALAPTEEAVRIYRDLAATNPGYLPDLAMALNNLGNPHGNLGHPASDVESEWGSARQALPEPLRPAFVYARARRASNSDEAATTWLIKAVSTNQLDPALRRAMHNQVRARHDADPTGLRALWQTVTGNESPAWLLINPRDLAVADAWVHTPTYNEERDHLRAHPGLLEEAADAVLEEALLGLADREAQRLRGLREAARAVGVEAAYRPLLLRMLAARFARANEQEQTAAFEAHAPDLQSTETIDYLTSIEDDAARLTALLLSREEDTVRAVLSAAGRPEEFDALLSVLARLPEVLSLGVAVRWAIHRELITPTILFYFAVARCREGAPVDEIQELLTYARLNDPERVPGWTIEAAQLITVDPMTTTIVGILAQPMEPRAAPPPSG